MKRTKKDEQDYDAQLRAEEDVKTEVIVELRHQNKQLWDTQVAMLEALLQQGAALQRFRVRQLALARGMAKTDSHCVPGCTRHEWDTVNGWRRRDER